MENKQDAWKMLLESLQEKDKQIWDMRTKEIQILQTLMDKDTQIKELIKVIAELTIIK